MGLADAEAIPFRLDVLNIDGVVFSSLACEWVQLAWLLLYWTSSDLGLLPLLAQAVRGILVP